MCKSAPARPQHVLHLNVSYRLGKLWLLPSLFSCALMVSPALPASAQNEPFPEAPTLRVSTAIVLEDVTVADSHGNPVHGLTRDSFVVTEDGKPQTVSGFEEHVFNALEPAKIEPFPHLPAGVFTNYTPAPETGAINVLLLDTLNTPLANQAFARAQALQFLKTMKPGTRIAIFVMNRELHLLQGFTSNPELLKAALNHKKGMGVSSLLDSPVSGGLAGDSTLSSAFQEAVGNDPSFDQTVASLQQLEAEQGALLLTLRAQYTLDAMNQMARYLAGLPGRKNLIWFSGSFPLDLMPDGDLPDPFAAMGDSEDEFRETVSLMGQSHVALYPVDVRGLMVNSIMNAENAGKKYTNDPKSIQKDNIKFFDQTASEQSTMSLMAEKTGGKAYYNTNGLKEAVDDAIQSGSNYYSIAYAPSRRTSRAWDGNYHSISVKLVDPKYAHAKVKLSYRVGYYADDPKGPAHKMAKLPPLLATSTPDPAPAVVHQTNFQAAMQFGAPQPTQIVLKVLVQPNGDKPEENVAEANEPARETRGPYRRYSVDYAADARHVVFVANGDGTFKAVVEFVVVVYDGQGRVVNTLGRTAEANVDAAHRAEMIKSGVHFHQEISVPVKGEYWLRIGVRDKTSENLGSVEVNLERVHGSASGSTAKPSPGATK